jgi:hypothetical protein
MNNDKIECNKCHKKFLILNREKFPCINCDNIIVVEKQKEIINNDNNHEIEDLDILDNKDDLDLLDIDKN